MRLLPVISLLVLGVLLTATVVPGVFTIDEDNYLVTVVGLRQGRLTVPGTEGLTPSSELAYFDPAGESRKVESTPIASSAPPLYAPLALPFSWLGWRGLVALNTLSFLLAVALVFAWTARHAQAPATPWLAAIALALGAYCLEYAQGVWPHMLAMALCTGAFVLASRARDGAPMLVPFAAGLLAGLAAGLRYQNVFLAACVGLGVLVWAPRRLASSAAFAAGVALPLGASAVFNKLRLGFWNPISKGPGYLPRPGAAVESNFFTDALTMGWARVVDFSTRPSLAGTGHEVYLRQDPDTGAFLVMSAVKKAWLQSSPWIVLALVVFAAAWLVRNGAASRTRRELRALSLVVFPTLALFAASGVRRTDGLCFNQRYFIELLPLVAVAFAWSLDRRRLERTWLLAGGLLGALGVLAALLAGGAASPWRQLTLLRLPLALAAATAGAWLLTRAESRGRALAVAVGACLGWGLAVHVGDDLQASRALRRQKWVELTAYERALPDRSALFAYWGGKDAAGPLQLERDLVILDVRNDAGRTFPALVDDLFRAERRVFVAVGSFPPVLRRELLAGRPVTTAIEAPIYVVELVRTSPPR